ncbi:unnamed protein product [Zymoseptoria tritici ST99CH_1E4]|uniref:DDHD domain-containing protein n=1 Tax=Zymoseptoria tritici ST99CH_1E4 TaxID=1276532 RepID=A0A2H1GLI1_ZYMTR|nr:unnamed protein product [Zymoseptoria tritici ST99CH_1E4]
MAAQESGKSYLSKLSPWSRSPTIPISKGKDGEPEPGPTLVQQEKGADHMVNNRNRLSLRRKYPKDCPPLRPQWFHAVDVPKRRPNPAGTTNEEKPAGIPKKYSAFSKTDSKSIEVAFQKLLETEDAEDNSKHALQGGDMGEVRSDAKPNISLKDEHKPGKIKVPVNEDYLFDVDVSRRELAPAYWHGPVYDVRRGTWFYQDGQVQRPCDENLAAQLEEGYLKVKAWKLPSAQASQSKSAETKAGTNTGSASQPRPLSWTPGSETETKAPSTPSLSGKHSQTNLRKQPAEDAGVSVQPGGIESTYRLFGAHMNSVVTYQDGATAWLLTDDFLSRMNYSVYQRIGGGGHFAGMKMTRGYVDTAKKPVTKEGKVTEDKNAEKKDDDKQGNAEEEAQERPSMSETKRSQLQRQMSALMEDATGSSHDRAKQDEEARKRDEREMEDDYREAENDDQGREIEHLILVTHGIGQRLGLRLESVNFVHDVNTLRKTLKTVYADSPDLRALNAELENSATVNSRVQVLPICWRHLLDFPKQSLRHNRKEHDIADTDADDEDYPSLEDITVEGVPAVRNLITDLALDILLYDSPAYKDHISGIVLDELNRIHRLFMQRNPTFDGKISLIGHSLGSAILFDILCRQDSQPKPKRKSDKGYQLDFPVEDFYALGSPIGLFQMLGGRTIAARQTDEHRHVSVGSDLGGMDDPMPGPTSSKKAVNPDPGDVHGENPVSRPKCSSIFNIFHPTDPISYRIEPLISPAMAALKPQPLPYTKRGFFGASVGQGFTGIGARVGKSVSSMWSSVASSLLTRGLGYGEESTKGALNAKSSGPLSMGPNLNTSTSSSSAGTNLGAGVAPPTAPLPPRGTEIAKINEDKIDHDRTATSNADGGQHPRTLIQNELETLSGDFEKRRKSAQSDAEIRDLGGAVKGTAEWADAEERGRKLRKEEAKVRRLNQNGRVDFSIQEGAFDINLIAAIASHLSYWGDEDVSHFIVSQLLSRHRVVRPRAESAGRGKA